MFLSEQLPERFQNKEKNGGYIGLFNDDPGTTFETIQTFLDECVKKA